MQTESNFYLEDRSSDILNACSGLLNLDMEIAFPLDLMSNGDLLLDLDCDLILGLDLDVDLDRESDLDLDRVRDLSGDQDLERDLDFRRNRSGP